MRIACVLALLASGCVDSSVVTCSDGRVCPSTHVCDEIHQRCVLPAQLADCMGAADGTGCTAAGEAGVCRDGVCLQAGCGDSFVMGSEDCDGAVPEDRDDCTEHDFQSAGAVTCRSDCTFDLTACSGTCGDGIVNGVEKCDYMGQQLGGKDCTSFGYYTAAGLSCSDACTFDVSNCQDNCGDDTRNGPESCDGLDLGNTTCADLGFYSAAGLKCTQGCSFDTSSCTGYCGDRVRTQSEEVCDGKLGLGQSCASFGFEQGLLACSGVCAPDLSGCSSPEQTPWPTTLLPDPNELGIFLEDFWSSSPTNVHAVGCTGSSPCVAYMTRWNGTAWTAAPSIAGLDYLRAVWGADANNVFAVGDAGSIAYFNGSQWAEVTSNTAEQLNDVWGTDASNVYAVGENSTVMHYSAGSWNPITPAFPTAAQSLFGIWGTSATNFYVVGMSGGIWHFNGAWTQMTSNTTAHLSSVWGASANEVYAVGYTGAIVRYNGSNWTPMTSGTSASLFAVTGSGTGDVYAVGTSNTIQHFDGVSWKPMQTAINSTQLYGAWAAGPREIYAGGTGGVIARFTGSGWARWYNPNLETITGLHQAADALLGSGGNNLTEVPGGLVPISTPMLGIGGSGSDIFAVGFSGTIMRRTAPMTWQVVTPSPTTATLYGMDWPFIVGSGTILRYETGTWTPMTSPTTGLVRRVWAASATEAFAVGGLGNVYRLSGGSWSTMTPSPTTNLVWDVWGSSPNDVWVAAEEGEIHHYNGSAWSKTTTPTQDAVRAISGTGPADIFATTDTTVFHYDGLGWSPVKTPGTDAVGPILDGKLFGGGNGTILEWRRYCVANESTCNDERDDDCDGYYDCGDSDCASSSACSTGGLCAGAPTATCNASVAGNTSSGTNTLSRYACDAWMEHGRELIYKLTPPTSGTVTLTLDSMHDLDVIVLAQGAGGGCEPRNPGCIAAASTAGGGETLTFSATGGTPYYIIVDGMGSSAGAFDLMIACP